MSKISLREYNREIDHLIEGGQIDEAIAHCRYVLEQYPKHVETYRLLGKAYLEDHRYGDAADILQRVLACIPDDFIANLGMSLIREDEGNLEGAIWHMERAFELQPANAAIQNELRRLYGRRDGTTPPKVHLTRGALARMSAKSHLYNQAITELRAILAETPNRYDLQVLLARLYLQTNQRNAAVDAASALLSKVPNCLEANRILAEVLPGTERAGEAQTYRERLAALDPYYGHVSPASPASEQVPDSAVTLEKLDYTGTPLAGPEAQPAWAASLGVAVAESSPSDQALPEWLASLEKESAEATGQTEAVEGEQAVIQSIESEEPDYSESPEGQPEEAPIPDWMQEAGWQASDETTPGPGEGEMGEEAAPAEGELAPAELPDWLRDMASEDETRLPPVAAAGLVAGSAAVLSDKSDQAESKTSQEPETAPPEEGVPDWLAALESNEMTKQPSEEIPEWLRELEGEPPEGLPVTPSAPPFAELLEGEAPIPEISVQEETLPMEGTTVEAATLLTGAAALHAATDQTPETPTEPAVELPDWLREQVEEPPKPGPGVALAGIEAQSQPVGEDELAPAELPDWLREASEAAAPVETPPGVSTEPFLFEGEGEPLAPAEIPDWLRQAMETEEPLAGELFAERPLTEEPLPVVDAGLEALVEPPIIEGDTRPMQVAAALPEVEGEIPREEIPLAAAGIGLAALAGIEPEQPEEGVQPPAPEEIPAPQLEDEDAALAWLESLAARQGALEEELLTAPEERLEAPPEWVQQLSVEEAAAASAEDMGVSEVAAGAAVVSEEVEEEGEAPSIPEEAPEEGVGVLAGAAALAGAALLGKEEEEPIEEMEEMAEAVESAPPEGEFLAESEALPAIDLEPSEWIPEEELRLAEIEAPEPLTEPEPELPDWLRGFVEEEQAPPSIETGPAEPVIPVPVALHAEPEISMPAVEPLDINAASLAQLERLPSVGFILAQKIVSYRDTHGAFRSLDELQDVPGVSAESAQELRRWLTLEIVEETVSPGPPPSHPVLADAWQNVSAGDTQAAVEKYSSLIEKGEYIDEVIQEIQEALQLHPADSRLYQALGDAYLRTDRLEEALDAYNRAEELLG